MQAFYVGLITPGKMDWWILKGFTVQIVRRGKNREKLGKGIFSWYSAIFSRTDAVFLSYLVTQHNAKSNLLALRY